MQKGNIFFEFDGDDFLDPNALLTLLVNLEENELAALAHPNYYVTDKTGEVLLLDLQRNSVNYEDVFQPIALSTWRMLLGLMLSCYVLLAAITLWLKLQTVLMPG